MSCLGGVLSALRRLEGVEAARIRLERSLIIKIQPKRREMMDFASLPAAIATGSTGGERYRLERIWMRAAGISDGVGGAPAFKILGWTTAFPIEGPAPPDVGLLWLDAEVLLDGGPPRLKVLRTSLPDGALGGRAFPPVRAQRPEGEGRAEEGR